MVVGGAGGKATTRLTPCVAFWPLASVTVTVIEVVPTAVGVPLTVPVEEIETPPGRLRIAFCSENPSNTPLHPDVQATFDATIALLGELGHTMIEKKTLPIDWRKMYRAKGRVSGAMQVASLEEWSETLHGPLDESTLEWLALAGYQNRDKITEMLGGLNRAPGGGPGQPNQPGGQGSVLGKLGTLLGGASAGSVLSGGLGQLLDSFRQNGQGPAADSWVGI